MIIGDTYFITSFYYLTIQPNYNYYLLCLLCTDTLKNYLFNNLQTYNLQKQIMWILCYPHFEDEKTSGKLSNIFTIHAKELRKHLIL